jgi:hypothetical protein
MPSKLARRIYNETPQEVKDKVKGYGKFLLKNKVMPQYRKSKFVNREFFKIDGDTVIRVLVKEKDMSVQIADNYIIRSICNDEYSTVECSEEEFNVAHRNALACCSIGKIV